MRTLGLLVLICLAGATYIVGFDNVPQGQPTAGNIDASQSSGVCPAPTILAVVNGASESSTISPGSVALIFWCEKTPPPASPILSVLVNGFPSYLYPASPIASSVVQSASSSLQVRVQFPEQVSPGIASLQLKLKTQEVARTKINLSQFAPGIFTVNGSGTGMAVAEHLNGKLVTAACPAAAGETVALFAEGLGPTTPQVATGELPVGSAHTNTVPTMTLGATAPNVLFADLSASLVGVYEVHFVVPGSAATGQHPVQIHLGAESSNTANFPVGKCGP